RLTSITGTEITANERASPRTANVSTITNPVVVRRVGADLGVELPVHQDRPRRRGEPARYRPVSFGLRGGNPEPDPADHPAPMAARMEAHRASRRSGIFALRPATFAVRLGGAVP